VCGESSHLVSVSRVDIFDLAEGMGEGMFLPSEDVVDDIG
jgi:hypothetical protein